MVEPPTRKLERTSYLPESGAAKIPPLNTLDLKEAKTLLDEL
jgi:hypothetical protein